MTPAEKRRRFRDLAKRAPVKTARQLEAEQAQLELDFTPAARKPARRPELTSSGPSKLAITSPGWAPRPGLKPSLVVHP
jgi:hypothetical protein